MTIPVIDLHALIEESSDGHWLREMIGFAAERLMAIEVEGLCGGRGARQRRWDGSDNQDGTGRDAGLVT